MDTSFYRPSAESIPGGRDQSSIALHAAEVSALDEIRGRWERETGERLSTAEVVRACLWRMWRALYPTATHLLGAPPAKGQVREPKLAPCASCQRTFAAAELSADKLCAECWAIAQELPAPTRKGRGKRKGGGHAKPAKPGS